MKYETLFNQERIPKIGFGTWRIGGASSPDYGQDERSLSALRSSLELGYTHFDTAEMYAGGHSEELLGRSISNAGAKRETLFITTKVTPSHLRFNDVLRSCESSLRRLGMDYIDLYLIHWPSDSIPLDESFRALNQLVAQGKVRHLGVSNFDLEQLEKSRSLSATPIVTNQVVYSLFNRGCARDGMLTYCRANNILLTAYSPIKEGRLKVSPVLQTVADAHTATPYQIALAWLVQQPGVIAIPMSLNRQHQAENLCAADIALTDAEMEQLR